MDSSPLPALTCRGAWMCGVQQLLLHPKFRGSPGGGKGIGNLFPRYPEGESPERPKEINKKRGKRRILHGLNKAAPRSVISWEQLLLEVNPLDPKAVRYNLGHESQNLAGLGQFFLHQTTPEPNPSCLEFRDVNTDLMRKIRM